MRRLTVTCRPRNWRRGELWLADVREGLGERPLLRGARLQAVDVEEVPASEGSWSTRVTVTFSGARSVEAQHAMVEELDRALAEAGEEAVEASVQELVNHALEGAGAGGALGAAGGGLGWRRSQAGLLGALAGGIAGALIGYAVKSWVTVATAGRDAAGGWRFSAAPGSERAAARPGAGAATEGPAEGPDEGPPG